MRLTNPDACHTESRRQSAKQNQGTRSAVQLQPIHVKTKPQIRPNSSDGGSGTNGAGGGGDVGGGDERMFYLFAVLYFESSCMLLCY